VSRPWVTFTLTPALVKPRRADARRSCERAFVHRKNRFFADKRSHCNKSGGRKPPVVTINANAMAIPTHIVGGQPKKCACVYANEFPAPTAG
jgi:hypothetical protein